MHVVPAGVCHWHDLAVGAFRRHFAGIRKPGCFLDGQSIHVSAQHYGWTVSVAQYSDNPRLADSCGHLKAVGLEMIRRDLGSPCLVHRQLGVGMDVFIDGLQFRKYRVNICKDRCWPFLIGHSEILSTGMLHCPEIQATTIVARVSVWRVASWKKAPDMGVAAN